MTVPTVPVTAGLACNATVTVGTVVGTMVKSSVKLPLVPTALLALSVALKGPLEVGIPVIAPVF